MNCIYCESDNEVGTCTACKQKVCFEHLFISGINGELVCLDCEISEANAFDSGTGIYGEVFYDLTVDNDNGNGQVSVDDEPHGQVTTWRPTNPFLTALKSITQRAETCNEQELLSLITLCKRKETLAKQLFLMRGEFSLFLDATYHKRFKTKRFRKTALKEAIKARTARIESDKRMSFLTQLAAAIVEAGLTPEKLRSMAKEKGGK